MPLSLWGFFISFSTSLELSLFWSRIAFLHGICYPAISYILHRKCNSSPKWLGSRNCISYLSPIPHRSDEHMVSIQLFLNESVSLYVPCLTQSQAQRGFRFTWNSISLWWDENSSTFRLAGQISALGCYTLRMKVKLKLVLW